LLCHKRVYNRRRGVGMEIKACPFCGEKIKFSVRHFDASLVSQAELVEWPDWMVVITCGNCGAQGPLKVCTEEEAVKVWNEREMSVL